MSKYIRSLHKLVSLTNDIFGDIYAKTDISLDTKAIVLFLAGSLHSADFIPWINNITALDSVNTKLKEINNLRAEIGPLCEDYLLLKILNIIDRDLNSDELQQFISCGSIVPESKLLTPALTKDAIDLQTAADPQQINAITQVASTQLQQILDNIDKPRVNAIIDTYTSCRQHSSPGVAYAAVVNAMQDILTASGVTAIEATAYSHKLATYALDQFVQNTADASKMLFFSRGC